jgi:hypothetical protein
MAQYVGRVTISVGGNTLRSEGGASIDIGGTKRDPKPDDQGGVGWTQETAPSKVDCEVLVAPGDSIASYGEMAGVDISFQADTGQSWVITDAFLTDTPNLKGKDGKVSLKFAGPPAEEIL